MGSMGICFVLAIRDLKRGDRVILTRWRALDHPYCLRRWLFPGAYRCVCRDLVDITFTWVLVPKSSLARNQRGFRSWHNMKPNQHIIFNKPCHYIRSASCFEKQRFVIMDYLMWASLFAVLQRMHLLPTSSRCRCFFDMPHVRVFSKAVWLLANDPSRPRSKSSTWKEKTRYAFVPLQETEAQALIQLWLKYGIMLVTQPATLQPSEKLNLIFSRT